MSESHALLVLIKHMYLLLYEWFVNLGGIAPPFRAYQTRILTTEL